MNSPQTTVEEKCLVIPTKTALPERCIRTNAAVSGRDYQVWDLPFIPRWLFILMLVSPLFLLFTPMAVKRRCKFKAGLSNQVRRRYLLRKVLAAALFFCPVVAVPAGVMFQSELWSMLGIMLIYPCAWIGLVIRIQWTSPMKIVREKDQLFWIKGCSPAFLASLSETVGET